MPFVANELKIHNTQILVILSAISKRRKISLDLSLRARIIILANAGYSNARIMKELNLSRNAVSKWRNRFIIWLPLLQEVAVRDPDKLQDTILEVLSDLPRSGAPRKYTDAQSLKIREIACRHPKEYGKDLSHWTHTDLANYCNEVKITKSISSKTVGRYLNEADIRPHMIKYWLHSTEKIESPETYAAKVNEICAMYRLANELADMAKRAKLLAENENAQTPALAESFDGTCSGGADEIFSLLMLQKALQGTNVHIISTDEMTGIQALERKYPDKPVAPGMIAKHEFEYIRHGTTTLIGFFNVGKGKMMCPYFNATRTEDDFVQAVSNLIDTDPNAYWVFVCDNLNTHKSEALVRYVAKALDIPEETLGVKGKSGILKDMDSRGAFLHQENHRIRFVYTPKHCSWMNQIEIWFGILNRRLLKRGSFTSVEEMVQSILRFIEQYNLTAKPFKWKYKGVSTPDPDSTPAPDSAPTPDSTPAPPPDPTPIAA